MTAEVIRSGFAYRFDFVTKKLSRDRTDLKIKIFIAAHLFPAFPKWELAPCLIRLLRRHRALPSVFLDKQL